MSILQVIFDVTIGRTVSVDPRLWQRHGPDTWFGLDSAELRITAQSLIRTEDGSHIHRFYTDEEVMLQVLSRSPDGSDADDFTIFHGLSSAQAQDEWSRRAFIERISKPWLDHEGTPYRRFWFEGNELDQMPVHLTETVYEDLSGRPARTISQVCMLYSRPLPAGGEELLLALEVAGDHGQMSQELMVGLPLTPAQFHA
jgi:hypothetical protein